MYFIETLGLISLICAIKVISSRNPVHSILALVLVFIVASIYMIQVGLDFFGLMLIIVYVGAIAILFLFTVMMLNLKQIEISENSTNNLPISILFLIVLWYIIMSYDPNIPTNFADFIESSEYLGKMLAIQIPLYTNNADYLLIAGLILFLAMIGAIILTCFHEDDVKRQDIFIQTWA